MGKTIAGVDSDSVRELPSRFFTSGKTFNVLGIIFGGLLIVYGFLSIALSHFQGLVLGLWLVFFGLVEIATELRHVQFIHLWFRFMTVYLGKGAFFIFFGTIIMSGNTWHHILIGICMLYIACMYSIAHFCYHASENTHLLGGATPMMETSTEPVPPPGPPPPGPPPPGPPPAGLKTPPPNDAASAEDAEVV